MRGRGRIGCLVRVAVSVMVVLWASGALAAWVVNEEGRVRSRVDACIARARPRGRAERSAPSVQVHGGRGPRTRGSEPRHTSEDPAAPDARRRGRGDGPG